MPPTDEPESTSGYSGPRLVRRRLGLRLRNMRLASGRTQVDVAATGVCAIATLNRIESGQGGLKPALVQSLASLYGADHATSWQMAEMARTADSPSTLSGVPAWFGLYVELESAANEIDSWSPLIVDGLLQTPAYTEAILREDDLDEVTLQDRLRIRQRRQQEVLGRSKVRVVLGAAALAMTVANSEVMAEQEDHLIRLDRRKDVDIRVLPWNAGVYIGVGGPIMILTFNDGADPDVAYTETRTGATYHEDEGTLSTYRSVVTMLRNASMPITQYLRERP